MITIKLTLIIIPNFKSSRFEKFSYGLLKLELMKYSINGKKRLSIIGEENIKIPTILIINPTKKS